MEINRDYYLNQLIQAKNDGLIKIVTGIRRCGKSYLLDPIFINHLLDSGVDKEHIIKIALDNPQNIEFKDPKLLDEYIRSKILDDSKYYIILDEIQLVDNFVYLLNGLLYERNVDIYVTGSNSKFLSSDIVTEFRGRGEQIHIYPLSFSEFYSVYEGEKLDAWTDYANYGGLPLTVLMNSSERKANYLEEQSKNVYINDVLERNKIKNNKEVLDKLMQIVASDIGALTNPKKISDTFRSELKVDIAPITIAKYLNLLEDAFLIEKTDKYDIKGRKYISTPSKYYFTDIGIRNAFIKYRQFEETHIMENIIYNELKRRGYSVDIGSIEHKSKENNEWKYKQLEVDFVCNKGNKRIYIQSAYQMPDSEKRMQEERPLLNIKDSCKKIIITKDYIKKWIDDNGIVTMSIFEFLLDMNSLDD